MCDSMPPLLLSVGWILLGLALLIKGSDFFIDGAAEIAKRIGISEMIIGLTLVAFGTSLPEWVSSLIATLRDPSTLQCIEGLTCNTTDLALGNVIGSNITNTGLVIGSIGLMLKNGIEVKQDFLVRDIPVLILLSIGTWYFALQDNLIGKWEGAGIFIVFLVVMARSLQSLSDSEKDSEDDSEKDSEEDSDSDEDSELADVPSWKLYALTVGGLVGLLIGSNFLVNGASAIAIALGVSESVVGLTMVAFGTSVPELATSMTAVKRGKHAMFLGGVIGSNSANLAIILGSVAFLVPVEVDQTFAMNQFPIMILFIFGLWVSMLSGRIQRWQSALLLLGYLSFTGMQFL
jgi:cation:H+ antiporter